MSYLSPFDGVVANMMSMFGGLATLKTYSDGTYIDGENIVDEFLFDVKVLLTEYPQMGAGEKQEFNTLILAGDKQCFMQPIEKTGSGLVPPEVKANIDKIQVGNTEYKIMNMKEVNPSGTNNVLYELHLRR